ncbi:UDP-N-acetylglucosamine 2-epimerase [Synechococcus sp. AH-551-N23]|nr:UDP-N-acetylglucosamine 2-epimerase [Synechococcus sp. AH-551-N23]
MSRKKILFVSGTRADFGKQKSLILACQESEDFFVTVFATGMHLNHKYGYTLEEISNSGIKNIFPFINHDNDSSMDLALANTISGLSLFLSNNFHDLIVVHGDRCEALAGAIVGSLNNVLVAHIEGGEVSGTIDEHIRHAVSKLSHIHLVSNKEAVSRLLQMGERHETIFEIGSPDIDIMFSDSLCSLNHVKDHYGVKFNKYGILMYHPVTTDLKNLATNIKIVVDSCIASNKQFIVIYPNNDPGSDAIIKEYQRLIDNDNFAIYPSTRFEYFLVLLRNSEFIIGNSSAGVREAPYYGVQSINIGSRQNRRASHHTILNTDHDCTNILNLLSNTSEFPPLISPMFGSGDSSAKFLKLLQSENFWNVSIQKQFIDLVK